MEFRPHAYQAHCIEKILQIKKLGLFLDRQGIEIQPVPGTKGPGDRAEEGGGRDVDKGKR